MLSACLHCIHAEHAHQQAASNGCECDLPQERKLQHKADTWLMRSSQSGSRSCRARMYATVACVLGTRPARQGF